MAQNILKDVTLAVRHVLDGHRIVVVFSNDLRTRVRVTRQFDGSIRNLVVTIGRPNYRERDFIKLCKKHGTKPRNRLWFPTR